ncbi:PAS domain S-box-containing protein [Elusimicrobium simillimum]|uniref:response regulator n=1 Tax=Elusimicrobium simillimum TaxID=3143438 RepID=UPI003C6FCDC6
MTQQRSFSAFLKEVGVKKIIGTVAVGVLIVLFAAFANSYITAARYMDFLIFSESTAFEGMLSASYKDTKDLTKTLTEVETDLAAYPVPKMDKRTKTMFFILEDSQARIIYSSDSEFLKKPPYNILKDNVFNAAKKAKASGKPYTFFHVGRMGELDITSISVFEFEGRWFGARDIVSLKDIFTFSSLAAFVLFIMGLLVLFFGISFVVGPMMAALQKDREQMYNLLNRTGVGIRVIEQKTKNILYSNERLKEDLGALAAAPWQAIWNTKPEYDYICMSCPHDINKYTVYSKELDKWFECYLSPIKFSDGVKGIIETYIDITERKAIEKQMLMQIAIIENNNSFIAVTDLDKNVMYSNPAAYKMTGYPADKPLPREQITPSRWLKLLDEVGRPTAIKEGFWEGETEILRADGKLIETLHRIISLKDEAGKVYALATVIEDITESNSAKRQLQIQSAISTSSINAIISMDLDGNNIYMNDAAFHIMGYEPGEESLSTLTAFVAHSKDNAQKVMEAVKKVGQTQVPISFENDVIKKDGTIVNVLQHVFPVKDEKGRSIGVGTILNDITAQKRAQHEVAETKERLEIALNSSKAGVWEINFEDNTIKYDADSARIFDLDYTRNIMPLEEAYGIFQEILADDKGRHFLNSLTSKKLTVDSLSHEFKKVKHLDGTITYVNSYGHPVIKNGKQVGAVGMSMDVTDRFELEEELREVKNRLEAALRSSQAGVWEFDYINRKVNYDSMAGELYGLPKEISTVSFDDLVEMIENTMDGNGIDIWLDSLRYGMPIPDNLASREFRIRQADGSYKYVDVFGHTLYEDGKLSRTVGMTMDVTARHKMEKDIIEAKEAAEEANKAKSQFLSNMSHEIRTPMNAIIGMTKIAKASNDVSKIREFLGKVETSSDHLLDIINTILDLSKIDSGKFELYNEEFDLEKTLVDLISVVSVKSDEKHQELFVKIDNNVPRTLFGDSTRLAQVLMNLLSNAVKFTPDSGNVQLAVTAKGRESDTVELEFSVSDTGIGLTKDQLKNLFRAFEQADSSITKRYGGTGLGLAISKRIVHMMNGEIGVVSDYGVGSEFKFNVFIKVVGDGSDHVGDIISKQDRRKINILVVDDSHEILEYMENILGAHNLPCQTADSGEKALIKVEQAIKDQKPFNIIFMDLKMEGLDGLETTKKIKQIRDDNSVVIMMSMYEMDKIETAARRAGISKFLSKPVFPSTIINTINEIVGGNSVTKKTVKEKKYNFNFKSVLVVEDMEINREILANILESSKVKVAMAEDGQEAVDMFKKDPYAFDLILMDVQMPKMDGYTATRVIRGLDEARAKDIPIIALTANAFKEDIDAALNAGMNGHLTKPIDENKLFETLNSYLGAKVEDTGPQSINKDEEGKQMTNENADLTGVNAAEGLKILNNNTKLYVRLLSSFVDNGLVPEFLAAVERKDVNTAALKAHTVKGVSANLSLDLLNEFSVNFDAQLKQGIMPDINGDQIKAFKEAYDKTINAINAIVQNPALLDKFKK